MKVYVIIYEDRHCDVTAEVFADRDKAVEKARSDAKQYCRRYEDYMENAIDGWEFNAVYSCEGDSVSVIERELQ